MVFDEWRKKYFPDVTDRETLSKMSISWAAGKVGPAAKAARIAALIKKWESLSWSPSPFSNCYSPISGATSDTYGNCARELKDALSED